ncbi:G-protein coupled receptor 157-like [Corticium candelabrum]|uniref:G-protein coupled receptor 157-like n=1 Tax=Corticium candelabrum TaxID=121492 RepID=UPI002E254EFE|nr:G-protein coupled receptor 157-like [Corticium candelabrum]
MTAISSNSSNMTSGEELAARVLLLTSCSLSLIGTTTIITTYVIWPKIRSVARQLLVFLSVADFLVAAGNAAGTIGNGDHDAGLFCKLQSTVTTFANLCSFFWTVVIASYIFISIVLHRSDVARNLVPVYHMICWIIPAAIVAAAFIADVLGMPDTNKYTYGWCWIRSDLNVHKMRMWMLVTGKGWEVGAYIVTLVLYMIIKCYLWINKHTTHAHFQTAPEAATVQRINRKMTLVPIIFICLRIWGTIRFFLSQANHLNAATQPALIILQGIGDSGQGWANCILFCLLNYRVRERLKKACFNCLCCQCVCDDNEEERQQLDPQRVNSLRSVYSRVDDLSTESSVNETQAYAHSDA